MTHEWRRRHLLRTSAMAALGLATAGRLAAPAVAKDLKGTGTVIVYDGGGAMGAAQRKAYSEPFEAETGIKVVHQAGVPAGVQRAAILAGAPKHDVANISGGALASFAQEGLLTPIDYGWWEQADRDGYDLVPASTFASPAMLYSMLVVFDRSRFKDKAPGSWVDIWNVRDFPGRRSLAAGTNAADGATFEIALMADGVPPDKLYPLDWERALRSLDRLRAEVVKWWANGAESVQLLVDKQSSAGSAWNGRVDGANEQGATLGTSWNQGILQWAGWAVPKGAANVENAMKYIAFMSRPEPQARFSDLITYGPTNARAFRYMTAERTALMPTAPQFKRLQIVQDYTFWNQADANGVNGLKRAVMEWERWVTSRR
jgi:putative spermidine/putrescine transport system substrate-binding protein